jgi:hypothetical protein
MPREASQAEHMTRAERQPHDPVAEEPLLRARRQLRAGFEALDDSGGLAHLGVQAALATAGMGRPPPPRGPARHEAD